MCKALFRSVSVLGVIFWLSAALGAQESDSTEPKTWAAEAGASLALARGNTETTNVSFTLDVSGPVHPRVEWTGKAFFLTARESGETNAESLGIKTRLRWERSERFFLFLDGDGIRDRFKNWAYRIVPSIGAGFVLLHGGRVDLSLDAGLSAVFTRYDDSGEEDSFIGLALGDLWAWKLSENAEIKQSLTFNADVSRPEVFFLRFEIGLTTALSGNWSVRLTLVDLYDNQPVGEGIRKNDLTLLAGFSLKI